MKRTLTVKKKLKIDSFFDLYEILIRINSAAKKDKFIKVNLKRASTEYVGTIVLSCKLYTDCLHSRNRTVWM